MAAAVRGRGSANQCSGRVWGLTEVTRQQGLLRIQLCARSAGGRGGGGACRSHQGQRQHCGVGGGHPVNAHALQGEAGGRTPTARGHSRSQRVLSIAARRPCCKISDAMFVAVPECCKPRFRLELRGNPSNSQLSPFNAVPGACFKRCKGASTPEYDRPARPLGCRAMCRYPCWLLPGWPALKSGACTSHHHSHHRCASAWLMLARWGRAWAQLGPLELPVPHPNCARRASSRRPRAEGGKQWMLLYCWSPCCYSSWLPVSLATAGDAGWLQLAGMGGAGIGGGHWWRGRHRPCGHG